MRKNGSVAIGDTLMDYAAFGSGSRKLVVLPGLSDGLSTVRGKAWILSLPYARYLREWTVYMFSRKRRMPEGYSIRDMAADQAQAMRSLGLDGACLLGVSQGGMIAQYIAADAPELVQALVLAVTAPYANATAREAVNGWIQMAQRGDHTALMTDTAERMNSEAYLRRNRWLFPLLARFTKPADYERFFRNAEAILAFDAREELGRIRCPTLILAGGDDRTVGKTAADELHRGIAGSELHVWPELGHAAYDEAKDFYERIFAFAAAQTVRQDA